MRLHLFFHKVCPALFIARLNATLVVQQNTYNLFNYPMIVFL